MRILKKRKAYCKVKCKKHTLHKVSQYKKGADNGKKQGERKADWE